MVIGQTVSITNRSNFDAVALNPDEEIGHNEPVRIVDAVVESLDLKEFRKLYRERGRCPYHPKMMLKIILYAYMNNVYSCRKIER